MRMGLAWDRAPDVMATQVLPNLAAAVRLVADEPVGPAPRPTRAPSLHRTAGHQLGETTASCRWPGVKTWVSS